MGVSKIGILGAGTMGSGIAIASAARGIAVTLYDVTESQLAKAKGEAATFFGRAVDKGRMSAADSDAAQARVATSGALQDLAEADLLIEAVFEDFDLKARTLEALSPVARPDALIATNTSCLKVSDLAQHVAAPERFLGLHYFSPAQINPLVEVVRGDATGDATIAEALAFCEATGKKPLLCKDHFGFAVNRFFCPYTNEASRCVDDGLGTPVQIDRVAQEALGVAAGPFFVQNIIKPRINLHAVRNLKPLGPFYAPADYLTKAGEAEESFDLGTDPGPDPTRDRPIAERLLGATFLPVLEELDEDVAGPGDIDMGAEVALRFGRQPCELMDSLGRAEVERLVRPLAERYGVALPESLARVGSLRG
ncbi:3-hydroxyacyl-CoA dehydrogenase family protein [Algihabitans albus]|uniref:3-hydroxyacyl-CoA dehydrogenase family protein n=1 Tax=Algihabitans albus TaxID=2164067 RepID=UPI000E5CAA0B|nr:3-hydroxyacyl-CoA dehydrogenase family protein [Algihabitans albus]